MKTATNSTTEDEYIFAFNRGDEQALAYYFRQLHPTLTHYANQWARDFHLAQEIAADAFVKTWKAHCQFDSYDSIKRYLYTIVRRDSYKIAKRLNIHPFPTQSEERGAADNDTPFSNLVRAETYRILYSALKKLSPGNNRVITMYYLEGKTTGEIARELNLHPSTVQTQKIRGIKALQKLLKLHVFWAIFLLTKIFFSTL